MFAREYGFALLRFGSKTAAYGAAVLAIAACGSSDSKMPATPPTAPTTMMSPAMGMPSATAGRGMTPSAPMQPAPPPVTRAGAAGMSATGGGAGVSASGGAAGMTASAGAAGMGAAAGGAGGDAAGMPMGTLGGKLMYTDELTKGMTVPSKYKCPMSMIGTGRGDNKSPPLAWTGGPADTKSFAIILFDTRYSQFHWALWDIPASVNKLPEGIAAGYDVTDPAGAHQYSMNNTMDMHAYFGPCSDAGSMSGMYEFRLFALNKDKLDLTMMSNGMAIQSAITGAMAEMVVWKATPE